MEKQTSSISDALWRIYRRPERPIPWSFGGNLPWDDPEFSRRMLTFHLDQSNGAASRIEAERQVQMPWLWSKLALEPGSRVLDVTCGPGLYAVDLADRGCQVTGVDFGPASIAYARQLADDRRVSDRCRFVESDIRQMDFEADHFDAALFLYGQLSVFPQEDSAMLLQMIAKFLRPGGRLVVELLAPDRLDKQENTWWFTDDQGLWGERPYLHLGERFWLEDERMIVERFFTMDLETGTMDEVTLCDQCYAVQEMVGIMKAAGFSRVDAYAAWDGLELYDAPEWVVYVAQNGH
ncbi:MAG: class I SAM-dependent methyltransferase [Chloroflexota bacterium]|jgi:SAM-dependent methyltransferase